MSDFWCSAQTSSILRIRIYPHFIADPMVIQGFAIWNHFSIGQSLKANSEVKNHTIHVIIIVLLLSKLENSNIYCIFFLYELLVKKQS